VSELLDSLQRLFRFLENHGLAPPSRDVRILEVRKNVTYDERGRMRVRRDELREVADYEARFQELLGLNRDWINVSCTGIFNGILIVSIETPHSPRGTSVNASAPAGAVPSRPTSINLSGPSNGVLEMDWSVDRVLVIG
jgi:hypothetical protein